MADRSYKLTLSLSDGSTIIAGTITAPQGPNGANGANGVTFTPSVSAAGVLSWTNNGGLTNPSPINIKGPKGDDAVITASDVENWGFTKNAMPKSGGTFTGEVKFGSTENFQGYYIKRMIGSLGIGTAYNNLDSSYKDGTWHRMWRLRFPSGSNFWGKIKITLYGNYSSFNASGVMSKSITCNFNTSNIYNNVGCYDGLGVNVEQDFRISEAIWNATANAWEVLIWQKNLSGNNSPIIMLECWTTNSTGYINAFNGITAQPVELTKSTSYSAQKASPTGGTKTVEWATLPVYENPLGEEIATIGDLSNKANLSGGNTFTGKQTFNSPDSDGYSIDASGHIKCTWLQATQTSNKGANTGKICVLDDKGWMYYRTPSEILAEAGGAKSSDIPDVIGATGTSTTSVMSQKATTDELAKKANLQAGTQSEPQQFYGVQQFNVDIDEPFLLFCLDRGDYIANINSTDCFNYDPNSIGDMPIKMAGNAGTAGQVLTSQGASKTPQWTTIKVSTRKNSIFSTMAKCQALSKEEWVQTTSFGTTFFTTANIWTDGDNIYYSDTLVLDKSTSTWIEKTWNGYKFAGQHIWTDGDNIYYSNGSKEYVLNKETSTWTTKTWIGLPSTFYGLGIWTDGNNIYYSWNSTNYVLDKATSTWSAKTWNGLTSINAKYIWTDGDNIYYSNASNQYILDKKTSTWSTKTWNGLTNFYGSNVWTNGDNIYYSNGSSSQYILDKKTSTWTTKIWTAKPMDSFAGEYVWTDGDNIYHTYSSKGKSTTYILNRTPVSVNAKPAFN